MGNIREKLSLISRLASKDKSLQFTSLAHHLNEEHLMESFQSLNRNKALGVDFKSWYEYEVNAEKNISNLVARLKSKKYKPLPARRVYIPKDNGDKRPIGISALENKIVERSITNVLEAIYENDFDDHSYGFRPGRNCHQALKELNDLITYKVESNHLIEADIKGFFDNVSHDILIEFLRERIKDESLLCLINKFLKAGYMEEGISHNSEQGTPQGSILSPILANIFLHNVLDKWFKETVKRETKGKCEFIRYADDFVIITKLKTDAIRIEKALYKRFEKFKLTLHPEKTKCISFGRFETINAKEEKRPANTFDFLGFTHFCSESRTGNFKIGRKTSKKKFQKKANEMTEWIKAKCKLGNEKIKAWWGVLKAKLTGHYQYYGVSENSLSINRFYGHTVKTLFKWLNRRSQKRSFIWYEFNKYLLANPLPQPRIIHSFYEKSTILGANLKSRMLENCKSGSVRGGEVRDNKTNYSRVTDIKGKRGK